MALVKYKGYLFRIADTDPLVLYLILPEELCISTRNGLWRQHEKSKTLITIISRSSKRLKYDFPPDIYRWIICQVNVTSLWSTDQRGCYCSHLAVGPPGVPYHCGDISVDIIIVNTLRPRQNGHLQMHFLLWKYMNFAHYFTEVCA